MRWQVLGSRVTRKGRGALFRGRRTPCFSKKWLTLPKKSTSPPSTRYSSSAKKDRPSSSGNSHPPCKILSRVNIISSFETYPKKSAASSCLSKDSSPSDDADTRPRVRRERYTISPTTTAMDSKIAVRVTIKPPPYRPNTRISCGRPSLARARQLHPFVRRLYFPVGRLLGSSAGFTYVSANG